MEPRIKREFKTVETMIKMYCQSKHKQENLCDECDKLRDYAYKRLSMCKFGSSKPICGKCTIHCYKPDMRDKIREVMRTQGPRMLYKHPIMLINHVIDTIRY